jgi:ribosomal protein S18 acetylase RimI-like enzyme
VIELRHADPSDVEFLVSMFLATLRESISAARGKWDEALERKQFEQQLQLKHTEIVQCDGIDVGFFMVIPLVNEVELHTLCIGQKYQCRGIGSEVTHRIVRGAIQRKLGVVLSVLKVNVRARVLYERLGFAIVGESEHHHRLRHGTNKFAE